MAEKKTFPSHVGIIMDGNGRWAKAHGVPRVMGHNAGMESMKKIVIAASEMGLENLTVYAFSTENWKRSTEEVSGIFKLIVKYVSSELEELIENNVHINIIGQYDMLPKDSVDSIDRLVASTASCDGLNFNIALNYGGRDEITRAVNEIIGGIVSDLMSEPEEFLKIFQKQKSAGDTFFTGDSFITESDISDHLYTGKYRFGIPDPDLIIRTSGELRTSNFLVWQGAYSELMFTDTYWPDFTPDEFREMIAAYANRDRRFGGRKEEDK